MKTTYHVCRCKVGWYQSDCLDYAHSISRHRKLLRAADSLNAMQRRCRRETGGYFDVYVLASEDGGRNFRRLFDGEIMDAGLIPVV